MAEGGFYDMEMEEHNEYGEYSDSKLREEYDDLDKKRDILLDDFRGVDFPDDVRVEYDSVEYRLVLIESEQDRRERRDEQEQEYAFIDDGGKTVTINHSDHKRISKYKETKWIDEDINYRGTEGGVLRTLGTKDNIRFVINKVLAPKGDLRVEGREERVKLLRAYLSVSETGGKVRPLLNSHEGIELLRNVGYSREGAAQYGGHVNTLIFKGVVQVASINTTYMKTEKVSGETTQSDYIQEYTRV